eukprot:4417444-Pyramimonas_sp.AAC.3
MNIVWRQLAASDHTRSTPCAAGAGLPGEPVAAEVAAGVAEKAARELPSGLKAASTTPSVAGAGRAPSMSTSTRILLADCARPKRKSQFPSKPKTPTPLPFPNPHKPRARSAGRGRPVLPAAQRGASCPVDHPYRGPLL